MPKKGQPNSRTYGSKLLGPKSEAETVCPCASKKFDVVYYELTGKVRCIGEGGEEMMPTVDQKANAKKMREEITTLEQFEQIGSYTDVAKKYHVGVSSAHGLMRTLRHNKMREEKELNGKTEQEESAQKEDAIRYPLKLELGNSTILPSDEQNGGQDQFGDAPACVCPKEGKVNDYGANTDEPKEGEVKSVTFCKECGDIIIHPPGINGLCGVCAVGCREELRISMEESELSGEALDRLMDECDKKLPLEQMWIVLQQDISTIRQLTINQAIEQAEKDFRTRLEKVFGGC